MLSLILTVISPQDGEEFVRNLFHSQHFWACLGCCAWRFGLPNTVCWCLRSLLTLHPMAWVRLSLDTSEQLCHTSFMYQRPGCLCSLPWDSRFISACLHASFCMLSFSSYFSLDPFPVHSSIFLFFFFSGRHINELVLWLFFKSFYSFFCKF